MKVSVHEEYTSVACNRIPEIADWNSDDVICYGATNAVVLYKTSQTSGNPISVLSHHRSKVYSVKWLRKLDGTSTEFISCSADKTAAIWTLVNGQYKVTSRLEGHTEAVTAIAGIYNRDDLTVFTASIDSSIKVWERRNGIATLKQTLSLNSGLCLTIRAHIIHSVPLLICGLDDHKVHLFGKCTLSGSGDSEEYHRLHSLAGHEDWVRGIDVLDVDKNTILVASCSQDTYVRLWRIQLYLPEMDDTPGIKVERRVFGLGGRQYSARLDAVLAGHEGWLYGVQWAPSTDPKTPSYRLLSSSLDKTLIIWEPEADGVWTERARVGAAGGHGLGFYGGRWGPAGKSIMGHSYNGAFHIWRFDEETSKWRPSVTCGGHFGPVVDARWEPAAGRYLASVSADQTTRLHAQWARDDGTFQWHELARPQVHGYDMSSLALVAPGTLASAAEEKVVRVFRAPHNFVHNFSRLTGVALDVEGGAPEGASVPSLGLSNKAVFNEEEGQEGDEDAYFVPVNMTEPPTEDTLVQNTLWPESNKLYGHGYEVFSLAAAPDGALLASACRAAAVEHAAIIIWETKTWQQIQKLPSHSLTVTQLAFSPDSRRLLSASRDRTWTLFQRDEGGDTFAIAAVTDKSNGVHSRIIWCCAWAHDGKVFGTGSRDGKICIWTKTDVNTKSSLGHYALYNPPLVVKSASVTALAFPPFSGGSGGGRVVATGFESGRITLYGFTEGGWNTLIELDNSAAHHLTVKRLVFSPAPLPGAGGAAAGAGRGRGALLASCGEDNLVRVYSVLVADT